MKDMTHDFLRKTPSALEYHDICAILILYATEKIGYGMPDKYFCYQVYAFTKIEMYYEIPERYRFRVVQEDECRYMLQGIYERLGKYKSSKFDTGYFGSLFSSHYIYSPFEYCDIPTCIKLIEMRNCHSKSIMAPLHLTTPNIKMIPYEVRLGAYKMLYPNIDKYDTPRPTTRTVDMDLRKYLKLNSKDCKKMISKIEGEVTNH